jgi:hypothetical protein
MNLQSLGLSWHAGVGGGDLLTNSETEMKMIEKGIIKDFLTYFIQYCFICRPSDSTVSEDAGFKPSRTVATLAFYSDAPTTRLDLINNPHSARSHPQPQK